MNEIEIGDYVRFEDGEIGKVIDIKENPARVVYSEYGEIGLISEITKHSKNIIDLIEIGDYVNGYKVSFIAEDYKKFVQCDYSVQEGTTNHYKFYKDSIFTILTKEQYENNCYKVGSR